MGKALTTDTTDTTGAVVEKKKVTSRATKAGLNFPVSRINRRLRDSRASKRVAAAAPVFMSAVLEYATAEILELASNNLGKRKRIAINDILLAIRSDAELAKLFGATATFTGDKVKNVSAAVTIKKQPVLVE